MQPDEQTLISHSTCSAPENPDAEHHHNVKLSHICHLDVEYLAQMLGMCLQ